MPLQIEFSNLAVDPPQLEIDCLARAIVNIEATIQISHNGMTVLHDEHWCVVDLMYCLVRWVKHSSFDHSFQYESVDDDDPELLLVHRGDSDSWHISSSRQLRPADNTIYTSELKTAIELFTTKLRKEV